MTRISKKTLRAIESEAKRMKRIYETPNPEVDKILSELREKRSKMKVGVIDVCEKCGKEITEILDVQTWGGHTYCRACDKERCEQELKRIVEMEELK